MPASDIEVCEGFKTAREVFNIENLLCSDPQASDQNRRVVNNSAVWIAVVFQNPQ